MNESERVERRTSSLPTTLSRVTRILLLNDIELFGIVEWMNEWIRGVEEEEFFANDALESDRETVEWNCTVGNRVTEWIREVEKDAMTTSDDHMKLSDDDNDCRRSSFDRATYVQMSSFPRVWVLSSISLSLPMIYVLHQEV